MGDKALARRYSYQRSLGLIHQKVGPVRKKSALNASITSLTDYTDTLNEMVGQRESF